MTTWTAAGKGNDRHHASNTGHVVRKRINTTRVTVTIDGVSDTITTHSHNGWDAFTPNGDWLVWMPTVAAAKALAADHADDPDTFADRWAGVRHNMAPTA